MELKTHFSRAADCCLASRAGGADISLSLVDERDSRLRFCVSNGDFGVSNGDFAIRFGGRFMISRLFSSSALCSLQDRFVGRMDEERNISVIFSSHVSWVVCGRVKFCEKVAFDELDKSGHESARISERCPSSFC